MVWSSLPSLVVIEVKASYHIVEIVAGLFAGFDEKILFSDSLLVAVAKSFTLFHPRSGLECLVDL